MPEIEVSKALAGAVVDHHQDAQIRQMIGKMRYGVSSPQKTTLANLSKVGLRRLAAARAARMLCTVPCSHLRSCTDCCGYEQTDKFDSREWHRHARTKGFRKSR